MRRALIALFMLLLASGCASNVDVGKNENAANIMDSELAYVLVGYGGGTYSKWLHTSRAYYEKNQKNEELSLLGKIFGGNQYYFVQLVPGTYTMVHVEQSAGQNATNSMTVEAKQQNEELKHTGGLIASFTVEKGKINYLGDITCNIHVVSRQFTFYVRDNSKEALEFLQKNYPKLDTENLVVIRLARPASGIR